MCLLHWSWDGSFVCFSTASSFGFSICDKKKKKYHNLPPNIIYDHQIHSPIHNNAIPTSNVFSTDDGLALEPTGGLVLSPYGAYPLTAATTLLSHPLATSPRINPYAPHTIATPYPMYYWPYPSPPVSPTSGYYSPLPPHTMVSVLNRGIVNSPLALTRRWS